MLSIPMIFEMIMESLFAVVDVFFVSQISTDAIATVGLTESLITIVYGIAMGLSMATTAIVARRVGERKHKAAGNAAFQAILVGFGLAVVLGFFGAYYAKDLLRFMGASENLIATGWKYTAITLGGNVAIMLLFLINAIFRGAGDASIAMRSLWISNIFNMILDPIFIFGFLFIPAFGVEGAAIASLAGRSLGVVYQIIHLFDTKSIVHLTYANFVFKLSTILNILKVSLGGISQFLIESASWIFLMRILSTFGSEVLAGYTIAIRIIIFSILPSWGLANAAATLVGQNLGANLPDRAEESVWRAAFFNLIFLGTIGFFFVLTARFLMGLFTNEPAVIDLGTLALQVICLGYVFFAYGMVVSQAFNGAGDTFTPTWINIVCFWVVQIPLAYTMAIHLALGPLGVFMSIGICHSLQAVISILMFRRGKWKTTLV